MRLTSALYSQFGRCGTSRNASGFVKPASYSSYHAGAVYDLKQRHREFISLSYTPASSFSGYTECYWDATPILAALPQGTFFLKGGVDI